jgi:trimeric autotransporter adhesin
MTIVSDTYQRLSFNWLTRLVLTSLYTLAILPGLLAQTIASQTLAVTFTQSPVTGGQPAMGTVTATGFDTSMPLQVSLSSDTPNSPAPPSITIPAGQSSVSFNVLSASVLQPTTVTITASAGGVSGQGSFMIVGGGAGSRPTITSFTIAPSTVNGGAVASGTVTIADPAPAGGAFILVSSNNGAAAVPSVVVIPAGQRSITFPINTTSVTGTTTALIIVRSVNNAKAASLVVNPGGPGSGQGTITGITFSPNPVTGGTLSTGTVTLSAPAGPGGVTVTLSSDTGSATVPTTIVIPAGSSNGMFPVNTSSVTNTTTATITGTSGNTVSGTLTINPTGGGQGPGQGTIIGLSLSPNPVTGGSSSIGTVTLSAPAGPNGVSVTLTSGNGAATLPANITIPVGQTSATFTVNTTPVSVVTSAPITATSANSVNATLTINPSGGQGPGQGAITSLTLSPNPVAGGSPSTGTVTLAAPAGAGGVLVTLTSGNVAATVPVSIIIPAGQSTGTFTVNTTPVNNPTSALITATSSNSATATLGINPGGPGTGTITGVTLSPNPVTGGSPSTGTVTISSPAGPGGVQVTLSSDNGSATVPTTLTIPAGQSTGSFTVTTTPVAMTTTADITASSGGSTGSAALTINPGGSGGGPMIAGISVSPNPVTGGSPSTGTVTLSAPAGPGGVTVTLGSNNGAAMVPASITIPAGQTSGTFPVTTTPVGTTQMATLTATSGGSNANTTLTINPGPGQGTITGVSVVPNPVTGGSSATGTVTLSAPAGPGGVLVTLGSDNGAATTPASITIPQGSSTGTFPVNTTPVGSTTTAMISAASSNTVNAPLTINPAGPGKGTITGLTLSPNPVTGGSPSTGTVTLSAPAGPGGVLVTLASDNGAATVPTSITIPQGSSTGTFPVNTTAVGSTTTANISATSNNTVSAPLTINPAAAPAPCVGGLTLNVNAVPGGNPVTATVTLTGPAPQGGTTVQLLYTGAGVTGPASILIGQGQTTGTFMVSTATVATIINSTIQALTGACPGVTVNLMVTPPVPVLTSVSVNPSTITLGGQALGTVTLSGISASDTVVNLSTNIPGTQIKIPATVTIPAGTSSATFTVFNLIPALSGLLNPVTGLINATVGGVSVNTGVTLNVL